MAITKVNVFLQDTQLGVQQVNDGVAMLFSPGTPIDSTGDQPSLLIDTPLLFTSIDDAVSMGIDADYDEDNGVGLYFNMSEFFSRAGTGAKLWVCLYNEGSYSTVTAYLNTNLFKSAVRATKAVLFDNRPRLIGILQTTDKAAPTTGGLSADMLTAIPALQTNLDALFGESIRAVGILDSGKIQSAATLPDCATFNSRSVGVEITTTTKGKTASVGLRLGSYAAISLSSSAGEVARGPVAQTAYLMDAAGTSVKTMAPADFDDLGAKQYLFMRERPQEPGVFFNDDATCNDPTKALSQIPYLRVGNSICDLAEWYFGRQIKAKVPVTTAGDISGTWKTSLLNDFDSKYLIPRINRGDASAISVDIQAVGNFVETRKIQVTVSILPNPTLEQADIYVFYVSSLTA
jgi:hypothetical protein